MGNLCNPRRHCARVGPNGYGCGGEEEEGEDDEHSHKGGWAGGPFFRAPLPLSASCSQQRQNTYHVGLGRRHRSAFTGMPCTKMRRNTHTGMHTQ